MALERIANPSVGVIRHLSSSLSHSAKFLSTCVRHPYVSSESPKTPVTVPEARSR